MKRSRTEGIVIHRAEVFDQTDYHLVVFRDGSIKRLVPLDDKGEHAKDYNANTIGIALFGCFASLEPGKNSFATDAQIDTCISLMRTLNAMYGLNLWAAGHSQLGVKGTNVALKLLPGHTCPGENLPLADILKKSGCRELAPTLSV